MGWTARRNELKDRALALWERLPPRRAAASGAVPGRSRQAADSVCSGGCGVWWLVSLRSAWGVSIARAPAVQGGRQAIGVADA